MQPSRQRKLMLFALLSACSTAPDAPEDTPPDAPEDTAPGSATPAGTIDAPEPLFQEDIFPYAPPATDLLVVMDNSCSMTDNQDKMATTAPGLFDALSGVDFHIGVVSTDMVASDHKGKLREVGEERWVHTNTDDANTTFALMVEMGSAGSGDERGADAAYRAIGELSGPGQYNEGFIREEAALHVLFVSDEADSSTIDPIAFADWALTLKPNPASIATSSIVWQADVPPGVWGESPGLDYMEITAAMGGLICDINDLDWSSCLSDIGGWPLLPPVPPSFLLTLPPVPESIEVWWMLGLARTDLTPSQFKHLAIEQRIQLIETFPPIGAEMHVSYEVK